MSSQKTANLKLEQRRREPMRGDRTTRPREGSGIDHTDIATPLTPELGHTNPDPRGSTEDDARKFRGRDSEGRENRRTGQTALPTVTERQIIGDRQ